MRGNATLSTFFLPSQLEVKTRKNNLRPLETSPLSSCDGPANTGGNIVFSRTAKLRIHKSTGGGDVRKFIETLAKNFDASEQTPKQ